MHKTEPNQAISPITYQQNIFNYYLNVPLLVLIFFCAAGFIATHFHIAAFIGLIIPSFLFLQLYRLKIEVTPNQLHLILGIGWFKKTIQLHQYDLSQYKERKLPWFFKGSAFKYDYQGNLVYYCCKGKALVLKEKNAKNAILIVSKNNEALFEQLQMHTK